MPNYCDNYLRIDGSADAVKTVIDFVKSSENAFDFNKIVPMPDYIRKGTTDWADEKWSIENWGTKWNSVDTEVSNNAIQFLTAWSPCDPVIEALATLFPSIRLTYTFYECGMCFCGKRIYENGELIFYFDGDYAENFFCEDDDGQDDEYDLSDPILPSKDNGIFEAVQDVEVLEDRTRGKLYYREYMNGKIRIMADGCFVADKKFSFEVVPEQLSSSLKVA